MADKLHYEIENGVVKVTTPFSIEGTEELRDLTSLTRQLVKALPRATGLLPPGAVSYREAYGRAQVVLVLPPGIHPIYWGSSEGRNVVPMSLAEPYRVIIADYQDDSFWGARMFYSPEPVLDDQAQLYHLPLPNYNADGYGGTVSVGWICLYHRSDGTKKVSIADKMRYAVQRCDGGEAYNSNMSHIDGLQFYRKHSPHKWLHSREDWEKKTEKDGLDWALSPKTWLPVKVKDRDHQDKHVATGQPLTLEMAMNGICGMYYHDKLEIRPVQTGEIDSIDDLWNHARSKARMANTGTDTSEKPKARRATKATKATS